MKFYSSTASQRALVLSGGWGLPELTPDFKAGHDVSAELYWAFCCCCGCNLHRHCPDVSLPQNWRNWRVFSWCHTVVLPAILNTVYWEQAPSWPRLTLSCWSQYDWINCVNCSIFTCKCVSLKMTMDNLDRWLTTQGADYLWLINISQCCLTRVIIKILISKGTAVWYYVMLIEAPVKTVVKFWRKFFYLSF